jgi:hypothetical protein
MGFIRKRVFTPSGYVAWAAAIVSIGIPVMPAFSADPVPALSPVKLFERCYAHLTRMKVSKTSALYGRVSRGEITPVAACMEVFNSATLDASGMASQGKAETHAVLRTFNDFHRTWFHKDNIVEALASLSCGRLNETVYDPAEPALHFTRALLSSNAKFTEALTGDLPMEALRSSAPTNGNVQAGPLLGVRPMSLAETEKTMQVAAAPNLVKYKNSMGAGFMGTKSFLALTLPPVKDLKSDGGVIMYRVWAKKALEIALCRQFPIVRKADAVAWVNPTSTVTFRNAAACMACHTTMDSMASTVRNVSFRNPGTTCDLIPIGANAASVTQPPEPFLDSGIPVPDSDPLYTQRPATGRLYFRSFDGTLRDVPVNDLNAFGDELVKSDDVYACVAKRYLEFFTGVSADLRDLGDPDVAPLGLSDLHYRNQVIKLGQKLKATNSLKTLVEAILSMPLYARPSQREPVGAQ